MSAPPPAPPVARSGTPDGRQVDREVRPAYAGTVNGLFVLVDRVQPVLVAIGPDGDVVTVASWADLVPPPPQFAYYNRAVAFLPDRVVVHELVADRAVEYHPERGLTAVATPDGGNLQWKHARRYAAADRVDPQGWSFRTVHPDDRGEGWHASATFRDRRVLRSERSRAVIAAATQGDTAVVVLQESVKRPVRFSPRCRTVVLRADVPGGATDVELPPVTGLTWPRRPADHDALLDYLTFSQAGLAAALRTGSPDASLEVGTAPSGLVTVTTGFSVPRLGPTRFCRRDEPFDELGNLAGCRELNVSLAEDIEFGLLEHLTDPDESVVWI